MQNMEQARFNMIEQQIRPCEVLEGRILELLKHVRREHFVPAEKKGLAFADMEIPLGYRSCHVAAQAGSAHCAGTASHPQ